MFSRVAIVKINESVLDTFHRALRLIGGIDDLSANPVTIKVGIYDARNLNYPTVQVVKTVVHSFRRSETIRLVESDNHHGKAVDRLQAWNAVFTEKVIPFSLSLDALVKEAAVCGELIRFSHVLFKPNVLVSLHVLRKGKAGSVFKNLLGLIPDIRKERFHDKLGVALIDIARAVGWIDLAVIDGTYMYGSEWKAGQPLERERKNLLVVGRDPVAVETVGSLLVGEDPLSIPQIKVANDKNLGEADIKRITVLGDFRRNELLRACGKK